MGPRLARLVAAFAVAACVAAAAASAAQTPSSLRETILTAGRKQQSVHYVSSSVAPHSSITIDGTVGLTRGVQRITFRRAGKVGHASVVVAARTAYLRADAFTLKDYLGFKAAAASQYGNDWIVIPHTHKLYPPIAAAVTLASAIDQLGPVGALGMTTVGPTTLAGQKVIGVRARSTVKGTAQVDTLYARASGAPLPVEEVATQGKTFRFTLTFDRWNGPVHVTVPKNPVSITTVESAGGPVA